MMAEPANPLLAAWSAPYGLPPFAAIHASHFTPAFEAAFVAQRAEIDAIVNGMSNSLQLTLPENVVPFRLNGSDVRNDSCGDAGVRTSEGFCLSVLRSGNCPSFSWVTVDPADLSVIPSS